MTTERLTIDEDSNLIKHARRELTHVAHDPWWVDSLLQSVQAFANAGHSGGSAPSAVAILQRLLNLKPLTDLTDDPDDWVEIDWVFDGERRWQNRRDSSAFSADGGRTYYLLEEAEAAGSTETTPLHTAAVRG